MAAKVRITSDFPTQAEVADFLRIPPSRAAELRRQLHDLHAAPPDERNRRKAAPAVRAKKK